MAWGKSMALYGLKDLEILETEKNYQEFFQHALDVRPSLRTKEWHRLVDSMADSYSGALLKKKLIEDKDFSLLNEILSLPGQKTNASFKRNRAELALLYFKEKLKNASEVEQIENYRQKIFKFWQEDPEDFELGLKLAQLYEKIDSERLEDKLNWVFYEGAAKSEVADFYCKRNQFQEAIVRHLNAKFNDSHLNLKGLVATVMHHNCWKEVKANLKNILFTAPTEFSMNLYQLLKQENELSNSDKDFFAFAYVINGPINGDTLNETWNRVAELKNDNQRREALLGRLRDKSTLPDGILGAFDETRKRVIANFIQKNVPEYFDFYTRECLSFIKGEKNYPDGNPTLHCRDLIELNDKEQANLVDPLLILQYQKAVKI